VLLEEAAKGSRLAAAPANPAAPPNTASISPATPDAGAAGPEAAAAKDPRALARALQTELKRVGCDPGPVDGQWGRQAEEALSEFARRTKTTLPHEASQAALQAVAAQPRRVCALICGADEMERDGKCVAKASPARRKPQVVQTAPKRKKEGTSGQMCWSNDRRNMAVVPCSDGTSSGQRAY
jgi:hypothetical protein